jgi:hypothetical protein
VDFAQKLWIMSQKTRFGFICEFCNKEFVNKQNALRHQRTTCKKKSPVEEFKCKYCKKILSRKNSLDRHLQTCSRKTEYKLRKKISELKEKNLELEDNHKNKLNEWEKERQQFKETIKEKDEKIKTLEIKCEKGKIEVYEKVCTKVLDKSTVTNTYIHPKLVNLPITTIHPLTPEYVKEQVANGNYGFDHYLKGEDGLVEFIYSITMCENDEGEIERNFVCTDPSRDSYHRLVETKDWQKDKGGKFVDVILNTLSGRVDKYHNQILDERVKYKGIKAPDGYDPDYVFKKNNDMHSGVVQTRGNNRRSLRQRLKKETSQKISV